MNAESATIDLTTIGELEADYSPSLDPDFGELKAEIQRRGGPPTPITLRRQVDGTLQYADKGSVKTGWACCLSGYKVLPIDSFHIIDNDVNEDPDPVNEIEENNVSSNEVVQESGDRAQCSPDPVGPKKPTATGVGSMALNALEPLDGQAVIDGEGVDIHDGDNSLTVHVPAQGHPNGSTEAEPPQLVPGDGGTGQKVPIDSLKPNRINGEVFTDSLSGASITALADDMALHSQRVPIEIRSDGVILDGHRRVLAAKKLGWTNIEARIVEGVSDDDLGLFVLEAFSSVRNPTVEERVKVFRLAMKELGERCGQPEGRPGKNRSQSGNGFWPAERVRNVAAEKAGFGSYSAANRADVVFQRADDETRRKVNAGKMSINTAYDRIQKAKKKQSGDQAKEDQQAQGSSKARRGEAEQRGRSEEENGCVSESNTDRGSPGAGRANEPRDPGPASVAGDRAEPRILGEPATDVAFYILHSEVLEGYDLTLARALIEHIARMARLNIVVTDDIERTPTPVGAAISGDTADELVNEIIRLSPGDVRYVTQTSLRKKHIPNFIAMDWPMTDLRNLEAVVKEVYPRYRQKVPEQAAEFREHIMEITSPTSAVPNSLNSRSDL